MAVKIIIKPKDKSKELEQAIPVGNTPATKIAWLEHMLGELEAKEKGGKDK